VFSEITDLDEVEDEENFATCERFVWNFLYFCLNYFICLSLVVHIDIISRKIWKTDSEHLFQSLSTSFSELFNVFLPFYDEVLHKIVFFSQEVRVIRIQKSK
jgi:hypothetical protein